MIQFGFWLVRAFVKAGRALRSPFLSRKCIEQNCLWGVPFLRKIRFQIPTAGMSNQAEIKALHLRSVGFAFDDVWNCPVYSKAVPWIFTFLIDFRQIHGLHRNMTGVSKQSRFEKLVVQK